MGKQPWKAPNTDQIVEEQPSAKVIAWSAPETDEIVKKKADGVNPEDSSIASSEPVKPSKKSFLSVNDPFGIGQTILSQLSSGFGDQIPKATAQAKEVATSAFQDANMDEYIKRKKSVDFQKYAREKEGLKWHQAFDMDTMLPKYKEQFIKDRGLEKTATNITARQPGIIARRKDTEDYVQQQKIESAETLAGIPQSYEDVKDPIDAVKFATNLATQGLWQIPLVVATKGLSGVAMEAAEVYDQQLDELAKKNNITRDEVIQKGLDKPAEGQLYAVAAASLDKASAGGLVDIIKKGGAPVLKKVLAVTTESLTEPAQGILEEMGGAKGAGLDQTKEFKDAVTVNVSKRINEALGGMFGSGVITALSPTEQAKVAQTEVKDSGDVTKAAEAAEKIQESVNNTEDGKIATKAEEPGTTGERVTSPTVQPTPDQTGTPASNEVGDQVQQTDVPVTEIKEEYEVIPRPKKGLIEGEQFDYAPNKELSESDKKNESDFAKELNDNFSQKETEYKEKFGNVLDADNAKTLSEEYIKDAEKNAAVVHNPSSSFVFKMYTNELAKPAPEGKTNSVKFVIGPPASGKTTYTESLKDDSQIIYNTIFADTQIGKNQINRALNAGKDVSIDYIKRNPIEAFQANVERAGDSKRIVPIKMIVDSYAKATDTINKIKNQYAGNDRVKINFIENNGKKFTPSNESEISSVSPEQLTNEMTSLSNQMLQEGKITQSQYEKLTGTTARTNERQHAILARIENSNADPAIKRGIKEKGDTYIPKGLDITEKEADDLLDLYGEKADGVVRDITNGITPDTRTALAGKLYQKYSKEGKVDQSIDIALWQADQSTQAGRAGNAAKLWKLMLQGGEDVIALAIEKERSKEVGKLTEPVRKELNQAREQIDAQIRAQIETKVQEGIKERIGRAKLISKEKKKEIGDFFDSLKVDAPKGDKLLSSPIPGLTLLPHVWNGAVEVIKQAVLTGANVANAVKAGLDYINANQDPIDEKMFTDHMTPLVSRMIPVEKIDPEKVDVPKLTGRKKKEFIDEVLKAHNDGKLTDKKFDDLYAKKLGVKELSTEDRMRIRELAKTIAEAEKFEEELRKDFTRENIQKHKEYVKLAKKANQQLQEFATAPNNIWDTLISIMQGNLLSSMSLVSNVFYNVNYQPLRFLSTGFGSGVDIALTNLAKLGLVSKTLEDRTIDLDAMQKGYFKGGWNGWMEGVEQLKSGTQADERNLREIQSGFNPGRAVERWANEDRTVAQKANDYIEGTIGWEAETMFRLLNLGDKPWKRAAEMARAYELGSLKGLTGKELQQFILLPDAQSEAEIMKAGQEATFQQTDEAGKKIQSAVTNALNFVAQIPIIGGPAKVILKSQLPYIKTPWNLIAETMAYAAPPVTFAVGTYQISKGNKRQGSILIGKAIVGAMIQAVAYQLFSQGLITGDDDKEKKKRDFQSDKTPPPNSINVSALNRMLAGGKSDIKDNDKWVSYQKMGVTGVLFDNYANTYKGRIADTGTMAGGAPDYFADMLMAGPKVGSATLDQTFLQGTSTFIEALRGGSERAQEQWLIKTSEAIASIAYPNTLSTLSKASDEFNRDTEDESFTKRLANVYKIKVFFSDSLPPKVSIWGDKITGNPEGRNKYAYYLFDPSKFKGVDTDDYRYQLYQSFKTDYDADWLPSMPQRKLKVDGQEKKLTPMEYELFATYVGQSRANLTSGYINSTTWETDSADAKKEELKYLYGIGLDQGKKEFLFNTGLNVKKNFSAPLDIKMMKHRLNKLKQKFP